MHYEDLMSQTPRTYLRSKLLLAIHKVGMSAGGAAHECWTHSTPPYAFNESQLHTNQRFLTDCGLCDAFGILVSDTMIGRTHI
jgi:hypothetical protein